MPALKFIGLIAVIVLCAPTVVAAKDGSATLMGASKVVDNAHASDGSERARGGPPRFVGAIGTRGVSYKGWQYVIYYTGKNRAKPVGESYGEVFVARRKLGSNEWQHAKVEGHKVITDDAHNRPAIAISEGDGRIHVTFDHHAFDWMNYANTATGVADNAESTKWDNKTFTFRRNFEWPDFRWSVTYPQFVKAGKGDLLMYFRDGGSGNGEMQKVLYDSKSNSWDKAITRISTNKGTFRGEQSNRGPYLAQGIQVGPDGSLQLSWLFRESVCQSGVKKAGDGIACNRGIYYAQSRDGGKTWLRTDGTLIADTSKGETVGVDNVGPPVVDVPMGMRPSNPAQTAAIDPKTGQFHLLISHLTKMEDESTRGTFHYVRQSDGSWKGQQSSFKLGGGFIQFAGDRLYAFGGERDNAAIYFADRKDGFETWSQISLPAPQGLPTGAKANGGYATWDLSLLEQGVASLMWQLPPPDGKDGTPSPVWVIDYRLPDA